MAVAAVTHINHHKSMEEESPTRLPLNSMSVSITIYWLLPMLCIAIMSRFAVDTGPAFRPQTSRPISINMGPQGGATTTKSTSTSSRTSTVSPTPRRDTAQRDTKDKGDTSTSLFLANKPYSYQEVRKLYKRSPFLTRTFRLFSGFYELHMNDKEGNSHFVFGMFFSFDDVHTYCR